MYEVSVGNIGIVYEGRDALEAILAFREYVALSESGQGRAGHEEITMLMDGRVFATHRSSTEQEHPTV